MTNQLLEQIPADWRSTSENILLSGYRIIGLSKENFSDSHMKALQLEDIKVMFFWGQLQYLDSNALKIIISSDGLKRTIQDFDKFIIGEEAAYCLIMTPLLEEGPLMVEGNSISKIQAISGFLRMIYDHHFEKLFDNILNLDTGNPGHMGSMLRTFEPSALNVINQDFLNILQVAMEKIHTLSYKKRQKIAGSLRWIHSAGDQISNDMLIKYCIAVEMVGTKRHKNVESQINKKLSQIYSLTIEEAEQFNVDQLIRLRANMVHNGHIKSLPIQETEQLRALYTDLLLYELDLPPKYALKGLLVKKLWWQLHPKPLLSTEYACP